MPKISKIGEKQLISSLIRPLFENNASEVGLGDDAAVVRLTKSLSLVLTIDKIPETLAAVSLGVMNYYDVGRYLVVANLSDIAAMGASPIALLLSLSLPPSFEFNDLKDLVSGIKDTAESYDVPVVGGDTKNGSGVSLVAAAIGVISPDKALTRSGANPGDLIYATGTPGTFSTALAYLVKAKALGLRLPEDTERDLLRKLNRPEPCLEQGNELVRLGFISACQDISDGVGQTLMELARTSSVGFSIKSNLLLGASHLSVKEIARFCNCTPESIILGPGADFDLIFSVPPNKAKELENIFQKKHWALHRLGEFTKVQDFILDKDGRKEPMIQFGWEHFSPNSDLEVISRAYQSDSTEK